MSSVNIALESVGELFITGFEGKTLSDETSAFLSQAKIGGVIIFSHNYEEPAQLCKLVSDIQECRRDLPLWISVDQEGGRVQRLKNGFSILPTAQAVGNLDSPKFTFDLAELMARELHSVGINLNFSPVADVLTNPKNPVIGDRAYGDREDHVSKMVTATVRGHLTQGVQACVKHFPGHGDTDLDSHFDLPVVDTTLDTLRDREIRPFIKAFKSRCHMLMVAHVIYKAIDPQFPASLSKKILRDFLRDELRYTRIVISDDLEMKAITDHYSENEAPLLALEAGCDLLIYRTEAAARKAYGSITRALEEERLSPSLVIDAAEKIREFKEDVLMPYEAPDPAHAKKILKCAEHTELLKSIKF